MRDETNFYSNYNEKLKEDYSGKINEISNLKEEKGELAEEYEKINIYLEE